MKRTRVQPVRRDRAAARGWMKRHGVQFVARHARHGHGRSRARTGRLRVRPARLDCDGRIETNVQLEDGDLVFLQNGSMTDASSSGSMTEPAPRPTKSDSRGWALWEKIARERPEFGKPSAFNASDRRNPIGCRSPSPAAIRASSTRWRRSPATRPAPAAS